MAYFQRSGGRIALLVLALVSLAISIYLTIVHYSSDVPLVCSNSGLVDCERVLTSRYSYVPGTTLPVSLSGMLWSIVAALLALGTGQSGPRQRLLRIAALMWAGIGMVSVFYLIYVEIVLLRTICAWCTAVHALVLLYFIVALVLLQSGANDADEDMDEHVEEDAPAFTSDHH